MTRRALVTGGCGFIGSALCRRLVGRGWRVVNLDALTYSGTQGAVASVADAPNYRFVHGYIADADTVAALLRAEAIETVIHLAAESHVDRSIDDPDAFVRTNVAGTARLLDACLGHWRALDGHARNAFRFVHVSTDEVYGSLAPGDPPFTEDSRYAPSSPYAATKAASDHLARAWGRTWGLPVIVTHCSNNYGPFQFPEKLIPLAILHATERRPVPVYGAGDQVRDWLHVDDHAEALELAATAGRPGETYAFGGRSETANIEIVRAIVARVRGAEADGAIAHVPDRPGHDVRYAIDPVKAERELGWRARTGLDDGLARTIDWYRDNAWWWRPLAERGAAGRQGLG